VSLETGDFTDLEALELAIDERVPDLRWVLLEDEGRSEEDLAMIASYIRAAYWHGYKDAVRDRGALFLDLGLAKKP
jgi:hypothetical protein